MHRFLLLTLLGCLSLPTLAEVYTYTDADGNRVFTDHPKPGNAKRVEMAPTNSLGQINALRTPVALVETPIKAPDYQMLRILVPEPDAVINDGSGDIVVSATSEPALLPNHNYRLIVDGQPSDEPGRSPVFPVQGLGRGTHQLAVEILDANGLTLERTPSQPLHIRLTSLEQKRKARPCKRRDYGVRPECPLKDKPPAKPDIPFVPFI
ncbi:MAG: DUF4124 domain-containing protein [Pseudomonas sp.]|uniref:DUF4124 domain-containing protein n=1 Tax=Pseudomonas sp. TaxID=306 RepID=UPI003BB4DF59